MILNFQDRLIFKVTRGHQLTELTNTYRELCPCVFFVYSYWILFTFSEEVLLTKKVCHDFEFSGLTYI